MDSSISYNDDEHIESHLSKSQSLELAYQEALRNTDLIVKDEGTRRLRLRILMLENENDDLHEQLALGDGRIDELEQEGDELRSQLDRTEEDARRQETDLKLQTRELNNLRAELTSMNGVTLDSTKLLTEKLSLTRELSTLKPELDHLRSQTVYQQTVLSEKLALQRQVNTLEVELETEKRNSKRATYKNDNSEKETKLEDQIETLQKDLTREKREAAKALKEVEKEFQDQIESLQKDLARVKREGAKALKELEKEAKATETRHTVLESRLEQAREKLRATKEQLKECQTELSQVRTAATKVGSTSTAGDAPAKNSRKRAAVDMSTDLNIGTPDGVAVRGKKPATKRGRTDQTMLGEKSMFSITPYLNRTVNVAPETPKEPEIVGEEEKDEEGQATPTQGPSEVQSEELLEAQLELNESSAPTVPKAKGTKKAAEKPAVNKNVLGEAKTNVKVNKPAAKKSRSVSTLEKVAEEEDEENQQPDVQVAPTKVDAKKIIVEQKAANSKLAKSQLKPTIVEETEPKKKKRKLLGGKTLFDEEDGEAPKRPVKISLGAPRLLGKGGLAGPKGGLKGGLATSSAFGAFSPLKKDRRGVGASFLA